MSAKSDLINPLWVPVIATLMGFVAGWFTMAGCLVLTVIAYGLGGDAWAEVLSAAVPRLPALVFAVTWIAVVVCAAAAFIRDGQIKDPRP